MQKTTDLSIDYSLVPSNVPALCIPYVFENIGEKRIEGIFRDLDIGRVDRIDLVPTQNQAPNGSKVNRVFVHINWKIDEDTNKIRTKLLCGKEVKVLYDGKYYWKIAASRAKEMKPPQAKPDQKDMKPRIEMDDDSPRKVVPRGLPRGPPRGPSQREPRGPPRDYRPKGDFIPRQVAPPLAPCLGMAPGLSDFSSLSLKHPEEFVSNESPANSWVEEEEYQPKTPPTPDLPPRDTRPLADIDFHEKVPTQVMYEGIEEKTPPKVTKRKKTPAAKKVEVEAPDVEATDVEA
jgi:hypothetical protein